MTERVAVLSYHSSPLLEPGSGDSGGMTVYVRGLAEELARNGTRTDIYTRASGPGKPVVELAPGVRVVTLQAGPRRPFAKEELDVHVGEFAMSVRAFAVAQRLRYDVVHSHYWQSGLAGVELSRIWDVPLVHSHHTLGRVKNRSLAPGDAPEPAARLRGEQEVIGTADVLLASTQQETDQLAFLYGAPHERIKTLHPGVDHRLFRPGDRAAARALLGLDAGDAVMLYVGRIQPLKGLELAIHAAEELSGAFGRKLVLMVVGGASGASGDREVARLRALTDDLGLAEVVRFYGPQRHSRLPDFYRAADVVVVCSHSESFGLAALEAHACATPVVGTAVGGLSYIVREGGSGFLVDTRDPAVFAGRLKTLLADDDLRASFARAASASAARFSWQGAAASLRDLYDCLVEERLPEACVC